MVVFESEWRATYFGSLRTKLILAPLWHANELDPQWTNMECTLYAPPHYLQACIENLLKLGRCCKQTTSAKKSRQYQVQHSVVCKGLGLRDLEQTIYFLYIRFQRHVS